MRPEPSGTDLDGEFAALWQLARDATDCSRLRMSLEPLAVAGHAAAAFQLASMCFEGIGGPRDPSAAFVWALRSARGGHPPGAAMAGDFYLHAEPEHRACVRLAERAVHWHEQAALAGHADAAMATSDAFRMGRGCERDFGRAYLFLLVALGCSSRPRPVADLLLPSLRTDLDDEETGRIEARAQAMLTRLPSRDADPLVHWRLCAEHQGLVDV